MKTYRLIYERTHVQKGFEKNKTESVRGNIYFKEKNDTEAVVHVQKWFEQKQISSNAYPQTSAVQISYSFVRLEEVRDISKQYLQTL